MDPARIIDEPEALESSQAPTTRLDDPPETSAPSDHLDGYTPDEPAPPKSIARHALEILAPIAAFLAVVILTAAVWEAIRPAAPGPLVSTAAILARLFLAYLAARKVSSLLSR